MKIIFLFVLLYANCGFAQIPPPTPIKAAGVNLNYNQTANPQVINICNPSRSSILAKPLFILNGYIVPDSILSQINPSKIQAIDVLKNAAATEKFGDKGKNGVIIITARQELIDELTKKGALKPIL